MCMAIPGKVVDIKESIATVDYGSEKREVTIMNPDIKVGDYVVVQNKLILQTVPEKEALEAIKQWEEVFKHEIENKE